MVRVTGRLMVKRVRARVPVRVFGFGFSGSG